MTRARELGLELGTLPSGPLDAITDVDGVRVGSVTLIEGDDVRTGVTVLVPHAGREPLFAGAHRLMLAFSTVRQGVPPNEIATDDLPKTVQVTMVPDAHLDPLFYAAIEATEGAIVNALLAAETMTGRNGTTAHALGAERLLETLAKL